MKSFNLPSFFQEGWYNHINRRNFETFNSILTEQINYHNGSDMPCVWYCNASTLVSDLELRRR